MLMPLSLIHIFWQGLGYYNRARNLKKAACQIVEDFGGQMPADFAALLALPGIGRYTACLLYTSPLLDLLPPVCQGRIWLVPHEQ